MFSVNGTTVINSSRQVIVGSGPSNPASPATGTIWFNTSTGRLVVWNSAAWVNLTAA